MKSVKNDYV